MSSAQKPKTINNKPDKKKQLSIFTIVGSTLFAAFGVQKNENRERDFEQGNIWHYIITGLIFTFIFIMLIVGIVNFALA